MKLMTNICRYIARGICINNDRVLLAQAAGKDNFFLIGGGIKMYESASNALVREIKEEIQKESTINSFVGVIENLWTDKGNSVYEINFLFDVDIFLPTFVVHDSE